MLTFSWRFVQYKGDALMTGNARGDGHGHKQWVGICEGIKIAYG